jgi:hypothetical protein
MSGSSPVRNGVEAAPFCLDGWASQTLLREVRERTRPGTSALFVISADPVAALLRDSVTGSRPRTHRLTGRQEPGLLRAFGTGRPAGGRS